MKNTILMAFGGVFLAAIPTPVMHGQNQQSVTGSIMESTGPCSPNVANASVPVSFNCTTGFSEKQTAQIVSFLNRLSRKQSTQQDEVLSKLDEILDAVQKSKNRIISDESTEQILRSSWASCGRMNVFITAPRRDAEAQALATQLHGLIARTGMNVRPVQYADISPPPGKQSDIRVEANQMAFCLRDWLFAQLGAGLKVYWDPWKNPDPNDKSSAQGKGPDWSYDFPIRLYVYSK